MTEPPAIWYFELTKEWWMARGTPREVAECLHRHVDAIRVTNAYEILPTEFIEQLRLAHSGEHD